MKKRYKDNHPAVNTGVFAWSGKPKFLEAVHELAVKCRSVFIPDECAAQLLFPDYMHEVDLVDDRWNCSPKFGVHWDDRRIVHCHGSKFLANRSKVEWLALLKEVWDNDVGGVRRWVSGEDNDFVRLAIQ